MMKKMAFILLCLSFGAFTVVFAQDVTVPDLTGLTVPEAAALLNKNGLKLGAENQEGWTLASGMPENSINGQSIPAGQSAALGTAVDINLLRTPNAILIYDDNDLTLVNNTGGVLNLVGLSFAALDGNPAQLAGSRWSDILRAGQCVQVWSIGRNGPKGLDECPLIQNWLITTNPGEHFWTGGGGATQFAVYQNGVQRAVCPVANPGRCEFFLIGGGSSGDSTEYVYFAYTPDRLAIINTSDNRWMALGGFNLYNNNSSVVGAALPVGDPTLYRNFPPDVETVDRLAPGQCLFYTNSSPESEAPPQDCEVIARLDIDPGVIFWAAAFELDSSDGQRRVCPAATSGHLTICVMPR